MKILTIWLLLMSFLLGTTLSSVFGPVYPITAAIFKDRYSQDEWNKTLVQFKKQGGDTVVFRAPSMKIRSLTDMNNDPDFSSCSSSHGDINCYDFATKDLLAKGIKIIAVVTYDYEEDYSSSIMTHPEYDKVLRTLDNRKLYRLVLPAFFPSAESNFQKSTNDTTVVVLLTLFRGVDPHKIALGSAANHNISVVFGLPAKPKNTTASEYYLYPAYFDWLTRVVKDHKTRYSSMYRSIYGYFVRDEITLSAVDSDDVDFYKNISYCVHSVDKKIITSANIDLNKFGLNKTVSQHIKGFSMISDLNATSVDFIAVHEGRGYGKAGYFWPTQTNQIIANSDQKLVQLLRRKYKTIKENATYGEIFTGSIQELFMGLRNYKDLHKATSDLWLLLEAEEDLQEDLCRPVDMKGSGNPDVMDRVSKPRLDHSLTAAGATVQKVIAFAYDPEFTCVTHNNTVSLSEEISHDLGRPIISNCSFHSSFNRSVVLIGYNFDGETQGFTVDWPDHDGKRHQDEVHGYYFELDYGEQHGLITSLEYTQLYDPYDVITLADHGYVKVKAEGSYNECEFTFDYRSS